MDEILKTIKEKFLDIDSTRYWGDDFDVRFYLVSQLKKNQNKKILDVGGGIGIISSELDMSNIKINLDLDINDLKKCKKQFGNEIYNVNGSMTELPFRDNYFDVVICSHILEVAKTLDLQNDNVKLEKINRYPMVEKTLEEIHRTLKNKGILFLTTPNNAYYQSTKLSYDELCNSISKKFSNFSLYYFNTYPSVSRKQRRLNLSNYIPKLKLKFKQHLEILNSLCKKDQKKELKSVSFYVEVRK